MDHAFFAASDAVLLRGAGTDAEDPADSLRFRWEVSIRHNNHIHPDVLTRFAAIDSFVAENHDDGTGISLFVRLLVTDRAGVCDTASVEIHPEIDLVPARLTVSAAPGGGAMCAFTIRNRGRMPAPRSRWRLVAGGVTVAEGDTTVAALDSVRITRALAPLPAGAATSTLAVDALGEVRETDESNDSAVVSLTGPPFPTARLLDTFERADSALGAPWVGSVSGLAVRGGALVPTAPTAYAVWCGGAAAGAAQEAYVRFDSVTSDAPEHSLLLAVQGTTWNRGAIQVSWSAPGGSVAVNTYAPATGWVRRGGPWPARFGAGDRFGARVSAAGLVTVYRNDVAIGAASVAGWEFAGRGGRAGLMLRGATRTRLVDFGAGDTSDAPATSPHAAIAAPANASIQPAGEPLALAGAGTDAEDAAADLRLRWRVTLPDGVLAAAGPRAAIPLPATLAGSIPIQLLVTDRTGRTDTARVAVRAGSAALDRFDRADGAPGPDWTGTVSAFAIRGGALTAPGGSGYLTWAAGLGADQEAWMQFDSLTATAPEHDLLLKCQGTSWTAGTIQVVYSAPQSLVQVNTYTTGSGWTRRGGPWRNVAFGAGDRMTARAWADGRVQVFRNGVELGTAVVTGWPAAAYGGRIGLLVSGATRTRISRFGGGKLAPAVGAAAMTPVPMAPALAGAIPGRIQVSRAIPNPVSHDATFALELPRDAWVRLTVFDLAGRMVWSEPGAMRPAGRSSVRWQGADTRGIPAATGMYVARVQVDGETFVRRFTVLH